MLKNYFKIAWRNLRKHKMFSFINLTGLTISFSIALVIFLIIKYELSFDNFHTEGDSIFRIVTDIHVPTDMYPVPGVPVPLSSAMRDEVTGLREIAGILIVSDLLVTVPSNDSEHPNTFKHQSDIILTDQHYFKIFDYQWLAGAPEVALADPYKVVLTESRAKFYFDLADATEALGREIGYGDSVQAVVSGVVKDIDALTDLSFKEFISISTSASSELKNRWPLERWDRINSDSQLFVKLADGVSAQNIEDQLVKLMKPHTENVPEGYELINHLQPLKDIHFEYSEHHRTASMATLRGLLAVAFIILVLGAINYINLTTARSNERSQEIGIRKTFGGSRQQLITQFLLETVLLTFIAGFCAFLLTPYMMEVFKEFLPPGLIEITIWQPDIFLFLLGFVVVVGFLTGLYPGLILSGQKPVWIMKNELVGKLPRRALIQKGLSVIQFAVSVAFVTATLIVIQQIRFAINKDLGFQKEAIVTFYVPSSDPGPCELLVKQLKNIPEIEHVSRGGGSPASTGLTTRGFKYDTESEILDINAVMKYGDEEYLNVYDIPLIAGKNLTSSDTIQQFLINESLLHQIGLSEPADAVGQWLDNGQGEYPIVGVVADFHTRPIHEPITPTVITNAVINSNFHVRLKQFKENTDPWQNAISKMESAWASIYPDDPFSYEFFDQRVEGFYQRDQETSKLLQWVAGITIFICSLGLLGLAVLIAHQKAKEIGIRKVLGASTGGLVKLLSQDFMKLISLSILTGLPIAWYFINNWLQQFAYTIEIRWWMLALPAMLVLSVALITIGSQVIKAALANPVDSLRMD